MRDTSDWLNKSFYISFLLRLCRCVTLVHFLTNSVLYLSLHYAYSMLSDEDSVVQLSVEDKELLFFLPHIVKMNDVPVSLLRSRVIKTEVLTKDLKALCVIFKAIYCHKMKSKIPVYVFS